MKSILCILLTLVVLPMDTTNEDNWQWEWSDEKASLFHYFLRTPGEYKTELVRKDSGPLGQITIRVSKDGELRFEQKSHKKGAFVIQDSILVYADYSAFSSGCELIAYNLEEKEEIWRVKLQGLNDLPHSEYINAINMECRRGDIVVFGNEAYGQYIEVIDLLDGNQKFHKVGQGEDGKFVENDQAAGK